MLSRATPLVLLPMGYGQERTFGVFDKRDVMARYVKRHLRKSGAERRQEIVDAALEVLGAYGLEGATVSRIAEVAGLTPGALYRHFPNRDAIFDAANRAASEQALSWLETSTKPDVMQRLEELGNTHASWTNDHLGTVVRPFFQALAFSQRANLADQMTLPRMRIFRAFLDLAEEGKRQGNIRVDVNPASVAWAMLMFAWIEDIALMIGGEEFVNEGVLNEILKLLLDSFQPLPPTESEVTADCGP